MWERIGILLINLRENYWKKCGQKERFLDVKKEQGLEGRDIVRLNLLYTIFIRIKQVPSIPLVEKRNQTLAWHIRTLSNRIENRMYLLVLSLSQTYYYFPLEEL